ncbi:heat shock protein DnaJ, partial [Pleomassaria siparia CBS 279.74]
YKVLGVSRTASSGELKKAYHRLSLENHPDRVPAAEKAKATERMSSINQAYHVLKDHNRREQYNMTGEL